jgi:hypothetical protein
MGFINQLIIGGHHPVQKTYFAALSNHLKPTVCRASTAAAAQAPLKQLKRQARAAAPSTPRLFNMGTVANESFKAKVPWQLCRINLSIRYLVDVQRCPGRPHVSTAMKHVGSLLLESRDELSRLRRGICRVEVPPFGRNFRPFALEPAGIPRTTQRRVDMLVTPWIFWNKTADSEFHPLF